MTIGLESARTVYPSNSADIAVAQEPTRGEWLTTDLEGCVAMDWIPAEPVKVPTGQQFDAVCVSVGILGVDVILKRCWHEATFIVKGWKGCATGRLTLYNLQRTGSTNGCPCFQFTDDTKVFAHLAHQPISFRTLIEFVLGWEGFPEEPRQRRSPLHCSLIRRCSLRSRS